MNPMVFYYQDFFRTFCADPCVYAGAEGGELFVSGSDSRRQAEHQHLVIKTDIPKRVDPDRFVILTLFKKKTEASSFFTSNTSCCLAESEHLGKPPQSSAISE